MKQRLASLWRERLSPTQKRLVVVGSVCTLLFTSLYLAVREPAPPVTARDVGVPPASTRLEILATNRLDDFTIASLSNSVNELHNSISQLQEQNANLQAEIQALKGTGTSAQFAPVEYFPEFNTPEHLAYLSAIMRGLPRIEQLEVYDAFLAQYPERRNQAIEELLGYRQYLYELGIDETTYLPAIGKGIYPDGTRVGSTQTGYTTSPHSPNYGRGTSTGNYQQASGYGAFDRLADFTVSNPSDPYAESLGGYAPYLSGGVGQAAHRSTNLTLPTDQTRIFPAGKQARGSASNLGAIPGTAQAASSEANSRAQGRNVTPGSGAFGLFASLGLDRRSYQRTVQVTEQGWVLITSRGRIDLRLAPAASADWQNTILYAQGNEPVTSYQGGNGREYYDNSYTDPYGTVYNSAGQVQSHGKQGTTQNDLSSSNSANTYFEGNQEQGSLSSYLDSGARASSNGSNPRESQATGAASSSWNQQLEALNRDTSLPHDASKSSENVAQPLQIKSTISPQLPSMGINLPAGAVFTGNLVTGVDAATHDGAKQDPYPVLVKLANLDFLPNNFKSNLESCFLLLSSYGDLSSSRALMRTQSLSCINQAGYIIEGEIKGYAVGSDGKLGLRGRLVSKQGSLIAKSLSAGLLQGLAEVLAKPNIYIGSRVNTSTAGEVGDLLTQAGLSGVGKAVDRVANFYLTLANKMFPLVEVGAGVQVDVVLTARVALSISQRRVHATPLEVAHPAGSGAARHSSPTTAPAQGSATSTSAVGSSATSPVQIRNYRTHLEQVSTATEGHSQVQGWTSALPATRQQLIEQFWQGVQGQTGEPISANALPPNTKSSQVSELYRGLGSDQDPEATTILDFPEEQ